MPTAHKRQGKRKRANKLSKVAYPSRSLPFLIAIQHCRSIWSDRPACKCRLRQRSLVLLRAKNGLKNSECLRVSNGADNCVDHRFKSCVRFHPLVTQGPILDRQGEDRCPRCRLHLVGESTTYEMSCHRAHDRHLDRTSD